MGEKCYFCPSTETGFCTMCKQWLCEDCRKNYVKRVGGMLKEKLSLK